MVVLTQALMVTSLYIPNGPMSYSNSPMRRADSDEEDEMDGRASSPYQNQDENSSPANDGFDDNEQGKFLNMDPFLLLDCNHMSLAVSPNSSQQRAPTMRHPKTRRARQIWRDSSTTT